jgi:hypothetical protein
MQQVHFNPQGAPLSVNIKYESNHGENLFTTYTYTLWSATDNGVINEHSGNNFNDEDDKYGLPTPVLNNNNRMVDVFSTLKNVGEEEIKVRVVVEIFQGSEIIGSSTDKKNMDAKATAFSEVFIKLTAN